MYTKRPLPDRRTPWRAALGIVFVVAVLSGCGGFGPSEAPLFERIPSSQSNISFSNDLSYTETFNIYTYKDFYAGGGVAIADVNRDGRPDVYLVSNQDANKLYLNRGEFAFEDVTASAGVAGGKAWSTGVAVADVDGNGLLDIYVTNAGAPTAEERENELFVNNGDGTFSERAREFGLADQGYSIHAAFFDYDNDGDLDVFVLNNFASKPISHYDLSAIDRNRPSFEGGDRLFRNDGKRFTDVTEKAGIFSSEAGFGLGVSAGDVNRDGCVDLYVSNDFFERDYLYINQCDGTFREELEATLPSTSTTSMGGDIADLDNDGYPEIFVSDMLPYTEERLKTTGDFIEWEKYQEEIKLGYHRKFVRNTLHYSNGDGTFSEVGRYAGVEATDWSWGGLMADFNLDGLRDIFVATGFYKDVNDNDHIVRMVRSGSVGPDGRPDFERLVEMTPSVALPNAMFENTGALRFVDRAAAWGLGEPGFSHGSAYGDLDGDGDLDLVVNNVNAQAFVYRNRAAERYPDRSWIALELHGEAPNTLGVGAYVTLKSGERAWHVEQMPQRGFESSVDPTLHVGLGPGVEELDTIRVRWPDGRVSLQTNVPARQRFAIPQSEARDAPPTRAVSHTSGSRRRGLLRDVTEEVGLSWTHNESAHNDFERAPLLAHMRSTEGPALCAADIDGDGSDELFVGGARGQPGALFIHTKHGRYELTHQPALEADRAAEDTHCIWVDVDGDDRLELYVAGGSSEFESGSAELVDRLYTVAGDGMLRRMDAAIPTEGPTGVVRAADIDGDGDQDLFVGQRMGAQYGLPVGGRILINDGSGRFSDETSRMAPDLQAGRIRSAGFTDAAFGDVDGDGLTDLVVVGEWMAISLFVNRDGRLTRVEAGLEETRGWWQSVALADLNGDGAPDLVAGNHGLNSHFEANPEHPVEMSVGDFNYDGRVEQVLATYVDGRGPYPTALRQHLIQVLPHLQGSIRTFADYAGRTVPEIFGSQLDDAEQYRAEQLATIVGWNDGNGSFRIEPLPFRAQFAPMYAALAEDVTGDETPEILLGGNLHAANPQAGRYDASHGVVLQRDAAGRYRDLSAMESGFRLAGEARALVSLRTTSGRLIVAARSGDSLRAYRTAFPPSSSKSSPR